MTGGRGFGMWLGMGGKFYDGGGRAGTGLSATSLDDLRVNQRGGWNE